jgi:hypothetical protein
LRFLQKPLIAQTPKLTCRRGYQPPTELTGKLKNTLEQEVKTGQSRIGIGLDRYQEGHPMCTHKTQHQYYCGVNLHARYLSGHGDGDADLIP